MATLFVSDVHLSARRPEIVDAFEAFLDDQARRADAVYVLGDLFDEWLGDDDDRAPHPRVTDSLARLSDSGVPVSIMHGNHDFLLGAGFERLSRCRLIPDPSVVEVAGTRVLLMHGDILCTRDADYQAFRKMTRDPDTQREFLNLPLAARAERAAALRGQSREAMRLKPEDIMDVTPEAVVEAMRRHDVRHFIHGHTHRPAVHRLEVVGESAVRIVLGDWYEQDSVLIWSPADYRLGRIGEL
jgi:UDP-2,3-diacylglucosamine hydrolase